MLVQDVLAKGYFPRELPISFTTESFAAAWGPINTAVPTQAKTIPATLNLARPGSLRRRLSIPNPFSQLALVRECAAGWGEIQAHVRESRISLTTPTYVTASLGRAIPPRRWLPDRPRERAARMQRARYVFRSDVSECYASIYTHSLEWALHTKEAAKARIGGSGSGGAPPLGERLDKAVRKGQDNQTKGIPISPDTSLVLAEIVLSAIDVGLQARHPGIELRCLRFMDDIEFYASTQSEAEDVLLSWQSLLADYELMVNPTKTGIREAPAELEAAWRTTLSQFVIRRRTDLVAANDIYSFFSLAFDLARANPTDGVLSYAIRKATGAAQGVESWAAVQQLMMAAAAVDPSCLEKVAIALEFARVAGAHLEYRRIEEGLNDLCRYHSAREHGSEVTWALWILRRYGLPLSSDAASSVARMQDNCALLLLFDLDRLRKIDGGTPNLDAARARAEAHGSWESEDWLLSYECARNHWVSDANIRSVPHWAALLDRGVHFFNVAPVPTTASSAPGNRARAGAGVPTVEGEDADRPVGSPPLGVPPAASEAVPEPSRPPVPASVLANDAAGVEAEAGKSALLDSTPSVPPTPPTPLSRETPASVSEGRGAVPPSHPGQGPSEMRPPWRDGPSSDDPSSDADDDDGLLGTDDGEHWYIRSSPDHESYS